MLYNEFPPMYTNKRQEESPGYKLLKKLGEGAYSSVFLADFVDVRNREAPVQRLACKIINTQTVSKEYLTKFLPRELDVLRRINHPHIIHIHSIYQKNFKYLIFMRFAENGDLLDFILRHGAIVENQARMWVKQISLAVEYLHALEIAHRDLKCENILISSKYNAKVADFGFSKQVIDSQGIRILSKTFCGSPAYSAPEILKGIPYNPKISDVWSLGVLIFVMLNKAMPFNNFTIQTLYVEQTGRKWKFKPFIESSVSKQVVNLIDHLLEPNVDKRYTVSQILQSEWLYMDHRLLGMTKEERLALDNARKITK